MQKEFLMFGRSTWARDAQVYFLCMLFDGPSKA
jgi:hypothetical protein